MNQLYKGILKKKKTEQNASWLFKNKNWWPLCADIIRYKNNKKWKPGLFFYYVVTPNINRESKVSTEIKSLVTGNAHICE